MEGQKILIELDYKAVFGLIAAVAWFIRLESKALYTERDLRNYIDAAAKKDDKVTKTLENLQKTMTEVQTSLARIEGSLEHRKKDDN
jgi:hypothetical protein